MSLELLLLDENSEYYPLWDDYVMNHPKSNLYQLSGWGRTINRSYGHKIINLMAVDIERKDSGVAEPSIEKRHIVGLLPLVRLSSFIFGRNLLSMPFFDFGGVLADSPIVEQRLLNESISLAKNTNVENIEIRQILPITVDRELINQQCRHDQEKVRMILELPDDPEVLMKSFKSKLRSQIRRPLKEDLDVKIGQIDLLDDFYNVFASNMRDLGSPVHSKKFIRSVVLEFQDSAKILIVYKGDTPLACSLIVGFNEVLENPWASSLRKYSRISPNMLLYWKMLEYACENGYKYFDFGRSSVGEGTYKFKKQWGSVPKPLNWYFIAQGKKSSEMNQVKQAKYSRAINIWRKLPVPITVILGPMIRKHIGL